MSCPDSEQLQQLLDERLDGPIAGTLARHIDRCPRCQGALELLTRDPSSALIDHVDALPPDVQEYLIARPPDTITSESPAVPVGTAADASRPLPQVPGYEIVGELGRGGMGVVYQARQLSLDRPVALKMILTGAQGAPEHLRRFRAEAEAVAQLRHPNFVQVYDYGVSEGCPYLALEFVEGGTLAQKVAGNPQSPRVGARAVETLAAAVHQAHRAGLVHRDLKPANVLVTADGVLKITDFGLVKRLTGESGAFAHGGQTGSGALLGTPTYMAPEQVAGEPDAVGPATDVYTLGVILYELLTGRPPFQGDSVLEVLRQVKEQEALPPSRLLRIPRDLETICLKCLEKEPRRRYVTAAALAEDLRRFQADEPIAARPVGKPEWVWRWCRRNPRWAAMLATVAGLLVVIAVGSLMAALRLQQSALRLQESADDRLWETKLAEARMHRFSDQLGRRFKALEALAEAARIRVTPELRDEAIAALPLLDVRPVEAWPGFPAGSMDVAFDGRLERYARSEAQTGAVSVRRVQDDAEIYRLVGSGRRCHPRFSDDGRFLAAVSEDQGRLTVWELTGERPRVVVKDVSSINLTGTVDFASDSRRLAVGRPDGTVRLYDLPSGQVAKEIRVGTDPHHVAFHPKKRQLAVACAWGIQVRDLDTGKMLVALEQEKGAGWLAWHPAGNLLAAVRGGDLHICLWDVAERRLLKTLAGHRSGGVFATFSHSGDLLVSGGWDSMLRAWEPRSGRLLFSASFGLVHMRFSSDDRLLAGVIEKEQLQLVEVSRSPAYRTLGHDPALGEVLHRGVAMGAGGAAGRRLLAVGMTDGVDLWDLASGTVVAFLPIGRSTHLAFDALGTLLTNGPSGVRRWPVADEPSGGGGLRVGPPELLWPKGSDCQIACSHDGKVIAIARYDGALVFHRERDPVPIVLSPHEDTRYIAVSPDGQWIATGTHNGHAVKIWKSTGGKPVKELEMPGSGVGFSPDGKWLLTSSGGNRLWRVGSWEERPRRNPDSSWAGFAFSPDGKVVTGTDFRGVIRLLGVDTEQEYAQLQYPDGSLALFSTFSPDGTKLLFVNDGYRDVHVWDLGAVGRELSKIGLGWDLPLPPSAEMVSDPRSAAAPLKVTVLLGDPKAEGLRRLPACDRAIADKPHDANAYWQRGGVYHDLGRDNEAVEDFSKAIGIHGEARSFESRARSYERLQDHARAAADYQAALDTKPGDPVAEARLCNNLACLYATGPAEVRAPAKALPLAGRAVRLAPKVGTYLNTLGMVYYRLGRYDEAVAMLRSSLKESQQPACDLFFLAMSLQRLGDTASAQDAYDQAEYWWGQHRDTLEQHVNEELIAIDAEWKALVARRSGE